MTRKPSMRPKCASEVNTAAPIMMALAAMHDLPCVIVPGGVTLPPSDGEDAGAVQTIQLAAAANIAGADALWQELAASAPELEALEPVIIPAVVRSVQVYRLRASGRDAHAICGRLTARGIACIRVTA